MRSVQVGANPLVINLVLHVTQEDEGRNDTLALTGLQSRRNLSVPHVDRAGQDRTNGTGGHGEEQIVVIDQWFTISDPIRLGRIAEVFGLVGNPVKVREGAVGILADWSRNARVNSGRMFWIAAAEAVRTNTTDAIFYTGASNQQRT